MMTGTVAQRSPDRADVPAQPATLLCVLCCLLECGNVATEAATK